MQKIVKFTDDKYIYMPAKSYSQISLCQKTLHAAIPIWSYRYREDFSGYAQSKYEMLQLLQCIRNKCRPD